jgi:hypothetical protein
MEISILGFTVNLEVLILIGIIYLILVLNTVFSCCNIPKIMKTMKLMVNAEGFRVSITKA